MVLPASDRISRVPSYSGTCIARQVDVADGAITLSGRPFQNRLAIVLLLTCAWYHSTRNAGPTTPSEQRLWALTLEWFGPGPRSLAATEGISKLMSFPPGTEMFQFSGLASNTYVFSAG